MGLPTLQVGLSNEQLHCICANRVIQRWQCFACDDVPVARGAESTRQPSQLVAEPTRDVALFAIKKPYRRARAAKRNASLVDIFRVVIAEQQLNVGHHHRQAA